MSETIVLGGGCFWCLEAAYQRVNGIEQVISGYSGGRDSAPRYDTVSTGQTGHAEVVQLTFDPTVITLSDILDIFWIIHDPTSLNRQGADVGTQYRSIILYNSPEQMQIAAESIQRAGSLFDKPIVTELRELDVFYPAEEYHQDYYNRNQSAGYCLAVINPKLAALRQKFAAKLRQDSL